MNVIPAILVDDEADSRSSLAAFLSKYCPQLKLMAQCANIMEAERAIEEHQPQILFLDIEMPHGNAFDLLEKVVDYSGEIIFITAFSQYAIRAFDLSAAHYLLKPIDIDELVKAVERAEQRLSEQHELSHARIILDNISQGGGQDQKLALPLINGLEFVRIREIVYCEAADNFTRFCLQDDRQLLICRKLKFYEKLLSELGFCRIHRSHLINLDYLKRYTRGKGGTVLLENGKELMVADARKGHLMERLKG